MWHLILFSMAKVSICLESLNNIKVILVRYELFQWLKNVVFFFGEVLLMSTFNLCFQEDIRK